MLKGSVAAGLAMALADFVAGRGVARGDLLAAAAIAPDTLADRDARLEINRYVGLVRAAKRLSGDPALPLRFGAEVDLSEVSIVGLIGLAAETMADALAQLNRYGALVVEVDLGGDRFGNEVTADGVWMIDRRPDANAFPELTEITFARMLCGARRISPILKAHEVHVTHAAPDYAALYETILGAPVTFNAPRNAYRIDMEFVTHRVQKQPGYVFGILTRHADALLAEMAVATTVRGKVEGLLLPVLHRGDIGVDVVADKLAMSRQTLYRRLKEEGCTFEQLLDDLRQRLALDYLAARKASVNETAYLVGFSDPAAFSRAFKRWTGKSPRDVRG
jgi:AraC-like DNA-binding protein